MAGVGLLPSGIYNEMFIQSHHVMRSVRQLELELLRDGLTRNFGWKCEHEPQKIKFSRKTKIWYCSNCGTLFDSKTGAKGLLVRTPKNNTWEQQKILEQQTATPMGPLANDMR